MESKAIWPLISCLQNRFRGECDQRAETRRLPLPHLQVTLSLWTFEDIVYKDDILPFFQRSIKCFWYNDYSTLCYWQLSQRLGDKCGSDCRGGGGFMRMEERGGEMEGVVGVGVGNFPGSWWDAQCGGPSIGNLQASLHCTSHISSSVGLQNPWN